jgi:hypothetical protein
MEGDAVKTAPQIKRPYIPVGTHPIEQGMYILETIAINSLSEAIIKWVRLRNTGAIIYGSPRIGKSYAIKYLKRVFEIKYKNEFTTFSINSEKTKTPNEDRFYYHLLKNVGHSLDSPGKVTEKKERLINFLYEKGDQTIRNQIVWFYDDAQRLTWYEFEWLMDIFNELQRYGINLTTILVGQDELKHKRNLYLKTSKQIVGRFMIHEKQFFGMKNVEELAFLLEGYDSIAEYPLKSGWSYTKFFFPDAFVGGYRLEKEANVIWNLINNIRMEHGIKRKIEVPMHYVISIINYVLMTYGSNDGCIFWPNQNVWNEGIIESGYIQSEVLQSTD